MAHHLRQIWANPNGRALILFTGMTATVGAVTSVTGAGDIVASPTTGNVVVVRSVSVDTGPCVSGAYTVPTSDGFKLVQLSSAVDCTVTLPASGSPFTTGTGTLVTIQNSSNVGAVPILTAGTPVNSGNSCASGCTSVVVTYTVAHTGDLLLFDIQGAGSGNSISSIADTAGNVSTCAAVVTKNSGNGGDFDAQWACPNTAVTGSDTFTVNFSGTMQQMQVMVIEKSGVVTSSPAEVTNTFSTTGSALNISTSGAPSQHGDYIFGGISANTSTVTALQSNVTASNYPAGFKNNAYIQANGGPNATYNLNWTLGASAPVAATIAAYKAANPVSTLSVCPGSGTALKGDTLSGCTPLPAGFSADFLWDGTNYQIVKVTPPATNFGPMDDMTASYNVSLLQCRELTGLMNWISPIVITIPSGLPSGCVSNMEQIGTIAAQVAVGSGMLPLESVGGNVHTGAQFTQSDIAIRAAGGAAKFGGTTAP